jgi:hypothetical protein
MATKFDDLMESMGVKPMGKAKIQNQKKAPAKKKAAPRKKAATNKKAPPSHVVKNNQGELVAALQDRVASLEASLASAKKDRVHAERAVTEVEKRLAEVQSVVPVTHKTVTDVLVSWGLETAPERAALFAVDNWLERLIGTAELEENTEMALEFSEKFVFVCGGCAAPARRSTIPVPTTRCEVCGGVDMERAVRKFIDATLINGRLRIVVVGRETKHHRMLRDRVSDPRLVLTQVPGNVRRDLGQAQTDVDHADVVIVWDADTLPTELKTIYKGAEIGGVIEACSLGHFLESAAVLIASH